MEFIQKFRVIAANRDILKPSCVVLGKSYPIMIVERKFILNYNIIILTIRINDDDKVAHCVLSPSYALFFTDADISEINAETAKFKLFYRKKYFCAHCHYMAIET
jgi:hypothetical protein